MISSFFSLSATAEGCLPNAASPPLPLSLMPRGVAKKKKVRFKTRPPIPIVSYRPQAETWISRHDYFTPRDDRERGERERERERQQEPGPKFETQAQHIQHNEGSIENRVKKEKQPIKKKRSGKPKKKRKKKNNLQWIHMTTTACPWIPLAVAASYSGAMSYPHSAQLPSMRRKRTY